MRKPGRIDLGDARTRVGRAVRDLCVAIEQDRPDAIRQCASYARRFRQYSPQNRLLIGIQRRDATWVRGRRQWEQDGCEVARGARAIYILAPMSAPGAVPFSSVSGFRIVRVYDVSDVVGPIPRPPPLPGIADPGSAAPVLVRELHSWIDSAGVRLVEGFPWLNATCDGATDGQTIWVRPGQNVPDRCAVLAHEIGHVLLHFRNRRRPSQIFLDQGGTHPRDRLELQAELTAFLVLALRGIDLTEASGAYLASWSATRTTVRRELPLALRTATRLHAQLEGSRTIRRVQPAAPEREANRRRTATARLRAAA